MSPTDATPLAAYALPAFFALTMGLVLLREIIAEPQGLKLAGASIDSGSRVISMLAPTVFKGVLYLTVLVGVVVGVAASFTKSGAAWLKSVSAAVAAGGGGGSGGGKGGRRLD